MIGLFESIVVDSFLFEEVCDVDEAFFLFEVVDNLVIVFFETVDDDSVDNASAAVCSLFDGVARVCSSVFLVDDNELLVIEDESVLNCTVESLDEEESNKSLVGFGIGISSLEKVVWFIESLSLS